MFVKFFESMWFNPRLWHWIVALLLLPISILWGLISSIRRKIIKPIDFGIPIISIGNLIVGGSGKTPFLISLAKELGMENVYIISRGYGRKSKGLLRVSNNGEILVNIHDSGDEAMLMATSLPNTSVIVSENRASAIEMTKKLGAKLILLDDGFNQVSIKKLDIILEPNSMKNHLPMPSGGFREFWFQKKNADLIIKEDRDFTRETTFENLTKRMLLVTAIANPSRLEKYLPSGVVERFYLKDHSYFNESQIEKIMLKCNAISILVTEKDFVKMDSFKLPISKIKLKLNINRVVIDSIKAYIKGNR